MDDSFVEEEVSIVNENLRLAGTLCSPANREAAISILMVAGSGKGDRNQNLKKISLNIFNDLAHQLAAAGIQTLRYDKRGSGVSEGDYFEVGHYDLVSDGIAWGRYLISLRKSEKQQVYALGHSEGTFISPKIVDELSAIHGLILVCPCVEDFTTLLHRQMTESLSQIRNIKGVQGTFVRSVMFLKGNQKKKQLKLLRRINATNKSYIWTGFKKVNAKWLRENAALNMKDVYSKIRIRTLAIAAEKDVQCLPNDAKKIAELNPKLFTAITIPDLSHLLKQELGEASILNYGNLFGKPVDERVVTAIVTWLDSQ